MNSKSQAGVFTALELALIIAIVIAILFPYSPLSNGVPSRDSGVFLYTGWRILEGEIPYVDVWDHKPPVIYYLNALGLWMVPDSTWGVWVVEIISLGLAAIGGYSLIKRLFGIHEALFSTFVWLFTAFPMLAGGNLTTEYALPFQFLMFWLFLKIESRQRHGWGGFFLGVLGGLLFYTRQTTIAIPLAIGIYLLVSRIKRDEFRRLTENLLVMAAGFLSVTVIVSGYFALNGALPEFWDAAFRYNFAYAEERDNADRIHALGQGINQLQNVGLFQLGSMGWVVSLLTLINSKNRIRPDLRAFLWMAIIALPVEILMVSVGGRSRIPYFLTLVPALSVFSGYIVWTILGSLPVGKSKSAVSIAALSFTLVLGMVFAADYAELTGNFLKWTEEPAIVTYIQKNTAKDDYVLMWGAETNYNFAARRKSPTRFVYQTALYNEINSENVKEFLTGILENRPALIVMKADERLSDFRFGYRDNQIGSLMDQIKSSYSRPVKVGNWLAYSYRGQ